MTAKKIKLSSIKPNPDNPRIVKDDKFYKLVESIKQFGDKMFPLRPIVVDENRIILGGNMRHKALKHLKYKEVPNTWIKQADELTEDEKKEFIIKDNVGFGAWDWDVLSNEWDANLLDSWGLDIEIPELFADKPTEQEEQNEKEEKNIWIPDCIFPSNNKYDVPSLLRDKQATMLVNPVKPYGAEKRSKQGVGTYHFYVDDYRFYKIWDDPSNLIESGISAIVEPNLSLYNSTPISYGLHLIFKKRWIARFLQSYNIEVFVDLNVNPKFYKYNLLGVPNGWNAFSTRGYADNIEALKTEIEIAQKVSGKREPYMIIYGGGKKAKELSAKHNLTYIESKFSKTWLKQAEEQEIAI